MTNRRMMMFVLFALAGVTWFGLRWANARTRPAHALGVKNGRLADCPNRPNCVSTQANHAEQKMLPIPLRQSGSEAVEELEKIILSMPGSRIVCSDHGYLHAGFRSLFLGFVDDVELWVDATERLVHFRSASRVGYSDFGVNRNRMETIRRHYEGSH